MIVFLACMHVLCVLWNIHCMVVLFWKSSNIFAYVANKCDFGFVFAAIQCVQ